MPTALLLTAHFFIGAISTLAPQDNPPVKLNQQPTNEVSQLKAKAEKGDGRAAFKLSEIYLDDKNMKEWHDWLEKSAELNDPEGQYFLGLVLLNDENATEDDKARALKLYFSSAQKGFAEAQATLGDCYLLGQYVYKDSKQARTWYELAAKQNHALATNNLGRMHMMGDAGFKIDEIEGTKLYYRAAYLGSSYAQTTMCLIYDRGRLIPKNSVDAFAWAWIGAGHQSYYSYNIINEQICHITLGNFLKARKRISEIKELMTQGKFGQPLTFLKPDIDDNSAQEIKEFKDFHAKALLGNAEAEYQLAECYRLGSGVDRSNKDAFYWYEKSANLGHIQAQLQLGIIYKFGDDFVKQNQEEAFKWFEKAAFKNDPVALLNLGFAYKNGKGVKMDEEKGYQYFKKSADLGDPRAQLNYAEYYFDRCCQKLTTPEENEICLKYLKMSAKQFNRLSFAKLAIFYGMRDNQTEGLAWLTLLQEFFNDQDYKSCLDELKIEHTPEQMQKAKKRSEELIRELLPKK